jgi:hypothetical protein
MKRDFEVKCYNLSLNQMERWLFRLRSTSDHDKLSAASTFSFPVHAC